MDPTINCLSNPKIRETLPPESRLCWPVQGVQLEERDLLIDFIKVSYPYVVAHPQESITFRKKRVHFLENAAWYLPVTITFLMDSTGVKGIVLLLNRTRGEVLTGGALRKPKTAHDLLKGKVVKKTASPNEMAIVDYLMQHPSRGLVEIIGKRTVVDSKTHATKEQYFERYCKGPLSNWIGKPFLNRPLFKLYLINGVLKGLQRLQMLRPAVCNSSVGRFTSFHGDMKLANLLLSDSGVHITDFGGSNLRNKICFTALYAHPVFCQLPRKSKEEWKKFIEANGFLLDLWATGIVCAIILCNQFSNKSSDQIPPLEFIEKYLNSFSCYGKLTQLEVDQEIERQKKAIAEKPESPILEPLWDLVHGFLRIDLNHPYSLDEALELTNQLIATHSPRLKEALDREDQLQTLVRVCLNPPYQPKAAGHPFS